MAAGGHAGLGAGHGAGGVRGSGCRWPLGLQTVLEALYFVVVGLPLLDDALGHHDLRLLRERVLAQVDRLGPGLALLRTPRLAPQPFVRQRVDRDLVLREVHQVLLQVGQRVRVLTQLVVDAAQRVADRGAPELHEVNHVQGGDVVGQFAQMALPIALLPEAEALGVRVRVTHRDEAVDLPAQVHVPELQHIGAHDLVGVDE
mmetsp:Transcript_123747/g.355360  ORF Transcript_123747/g.355360 Transcript_123747/m.355360 type:complete len:202 (+) Transcript_123747:166-771(+)